MIKVFQLFVVCEECEKVIWQNGFCCKLGEVDGWVVFGLIIVFGMIYFVVVGFQGLWLMVFDYVGVIDELDLLVVQFLGFGIVCYVFDMFGQFYGVLLCVYQLVVSLFDVLFQEFEVKIKGFLMNIEVERLVVQRIG